MHPRLQQLGEVIRRRIPPRTLLLLPSEYFFGRSFELPANADPEEIHSFAELSLEGVSPFPVEQLAWGYLRHPQSERIYVYAAARPRLRREGFDDLEAHYQVFPNFIACYGHIFEQDTIQICFEGRTLAALWMAAGDPVPRKVIARTIHPEERGEEVDEEGAFPPPIVSDEAILAGREQLLAQISTTGYQIVPGVRLGIGYHIDGESTFRFVYRELRDPEAETDTGSHTLPFNRDTVWEADVRETAYKANMQKQREQSRYLWGALMGAGIAAALLLLAQLAGVALNLWGNSREATFLEQEPRAAEIQSSENLLFTLLDFSGQELKPFSMLAVLNAERPKEVFFTRADSTGWNTLRLTMEGSNPGLLNSYINRLEASQYVAGVDVRRQDTGSRGSTFSVEVEFTDLPDLAPLPPATADEEANEDNEDEET